MKLIGLWEVQSDSWFIDKPFDKVTEAVAAIPPEWRDGSVELRWYPSGLPLSENPEDV